MMRAWIAIGVCLFVIACGGCSGGSAPGAGGTGEKDALAVYEAAFRYQLQKQGKEAEAYLSVDDKDAPAELLDKLRKDWPNLKPGSEAPKDKGYRMYVKNLKWTGNGTAEVKAGHWFPTKFAGEGGFGTHHLIHKGGQWVVDNVTDQVMS